jgi:hypothetical protein
MVQTAKSAIGNCVEKLITCFVAGRSITVPDAPELLAVSLFEEFLYIDSSYQYGWLSGFTVSRILSSFVALYLGNIIQEGV